MDSHRNCLQDLADLEQAVAARGKLHPEVQRIPGFGALYVIGTGEHTLVMVALYTSEQDAVAVSAQARAHLG